MNRSWPAIASIMLTFLAPTPVLSQLIPSEKASVSQTIDGTTITVNYSRPRSRGRDSLIYGTMEPWGRAWTPGADDATTIEFNRPVHILGNAIPAGRYSVWLVLRENSPWTLVLEPRANLFHTQHPDSNSRQFRASITPQAVPHTEALTWSFPAVSITGVTLEMRWGLRGVSIPVGIIPTFPLSISAADAAPYLGEYQLNGQRFTVEMRGNALVAIQRTGDSDNPTEYQLLPLGNDRFVQGLMLRGEVARTRADTYVQFTRTDGRVTGLETWADDKKTGTAKRRP
ncbi:MAG: DUF2911 domain-containing protein [Gemmatimonadales bacterium]